MIIHFFSFISSYGIFKNLRQKRYITDSLLRFVILFGLFSIFLSSCIPTKQNVSSSQAYHQLERDINLNINLNHEEIQKRHLQIEQIYKDNNTILSSEQNDEVARLQGEIEYIWTEIDKTVEYKSKEDVQSFLNQEKVNFLAKDGEITSKLRALDRKVYKEGRQLTPEEQAQLNMLHTQRGEIATKMTKKTKEIWAKYEFWQKAWKEKEKARLFKEKIAQGPNICGNLDLDFGTPNYRHRMYSHGFGFNWHTERNIKISSDVDVYDSRTPIGDNVRIKNLGPYGDRGTFIIKGLMHQNSYVVFCPQNKEDYVFERDWEAKPDGLYFQPGGGFLVPMSNPLTKCSRMRGGCYPGNRVKLQDEEGCWCWKTEKKDERNAIVIFYERHDETSCCQNP